MNKTFRDKDVLNTTMKEEAHYEMEITFDYQIDNNGGVISLWSNNAIAGKVTFKFLQNEIMEIDHTEVDPIFAGKGFGKLLIDEAVVFAQKSKLKITPTCDFAKKILNNR